ncbi:asparagine synthase (glutamine-hydrolyzing) [Paucibacter sp. DJ2R-2]|uniref:asparagine synthase (glutamine-hydrolyzing) n=1 Tax=Paucibacter sp. DJ2R-2 TaxID=2893558 RepID=UPI0021E47583|nr:asparagine synthase (glutamine-hydrolyzing) [Paucibacter sp. DJ2R-2]MCV2422814.1 asparagine synthase (glutamine-hydrolyzing) [Paucibacter sp. DJ4R-1]MCV2441045.1 asparagine synthase (glutamine-hydrolyzing) [Paucibacter sp. DJ2R-2]
MCGVTGLVFKTGGSVRAEAALHALRRRGPDASGAVLSELGANSVWLGHTRLAIQDLTEAGAQPMVSVDRRWLLTFNGEIYNHQDLRAELSRSWRGHSDTETLVEAISQWGVEATVKRLNGIFAFAVLDQLKRELYLIRDPFGVKPLYFAQTPKGFGFASEIRSLCAVTEQRFEVDAESLATFLSLRFVPSPNTLLAGVQRLPPGHIHCVPVDGGATSVTRYIEPSSARFAGGLEEAAAAYQVGVAQAVKRQMLSDVPVGVLLSGGIDSALVAAMAADAGVQAPCFTVGYKEDSADCEIGDAAHTAQVLGLPHHVVKLDHEDLWQAFELAVSATEEPLVTTSALPMWYLCQRAREDVTVVLTGQGSDELLGGYRRYQGELVRDIPMFKTLVSVARPLLERLPGVPAAVLRSAQSAAIARVNERFESEYCVFNAAARGRLIGKTGSGRALSSIQTWLDWSAAGRPLSAAEQMMAIDVRMGLADDLLLYGDKVSMAHSLEARVPLLDTELVRFVESLPAAFKLALGKTKIIHKQMAQSYLPKEIVNRPKRGFQVPVASMLRQEWKDRCHALLFQDPALAGLGFELGEVARLWDEHQRGFRDRSRELFALLGLAVWRRQMADVIAA